MVDRSFNGNGRFGSERSLWCSSSNDISLWNYEISSGKGAVDIGGSESELTIYFHSEYPWNFRDLMWLLNSGSWSSRGCNVDRMKGILSGCTWYGIFDALNETTFHNQRSQKKSWSFNVLHKDVMRFPLTVKNEETLGTFGKNRFSFSSLIILFFFEKSDLFVSTENWYFRRDGTKVGHCFPNIRIVKETKLSLEKGEGRKKKED